MFVRHPAIPNEHSKASDTIFALRFSDHELTFLCATGIEREVDLHGGSPASAGFFSSVCSRQGVQAAEQSQNVF